MKQDIEVLAIRLAKLFKKDENDGNTLKLISGQVVSFDKDSGFAYVQTGEKSKLRLLNKSGEQLSAGDSVWIGYQASLADGVIIIRNGTPVLMGVGEDLGNGNERFNGYNPYTDAKNTVTDIANSQNCTLRGMGNSIDSGTQSEVGGFFNKIVKIFESIVMGSNNVIKYASQSLIAGINNRIIHIDSSLVAGNSNYVSGGSNQCNIIGGNSNVSYHEESIIGGTQNISGAIPTMANPNMGSAISSYKDTDTELSGGLLPGFMSSGSMAGGYNILGGRGNTASGSSIAGGGNNMAVDASAAAGEHNIAIDRSFTFGRNCKAIGYSFAGGEGSSAGSQWTDEVDENSSPYNSYTFVTGSKAGNCNFAFGKNCKAYNNSVAIGEELQNREAYSFLCGKYNAVSQGSGYLFCVGNGTGNGSRSNALTLDSSGNLTIQGSYSSAGADGTEYFEWEDANPSGEDRAGRFVTLIGDKLKLADENDEYILGVISATPSFVGNDDMGQWHGKYKKDIFGRVITENIDGELRPVISDDYDSSREYVPRSERREWDYASSSGRLIVIDDGSCIVNGYCKPMKDGIAGLSEKSTEYRVIQRLDESHIMIYIK